MDSRKSNREPIEVSVDAVFEVSTQKFGELDFA